MSVLLVSVLLARPDSDCMAQPRRTAAFPKFHVQKERSSFARPAISQLSATLNPTLATRITTCLCLHRASHLQLWSDGVKARSVQLCVFGFGLPQTGDVGVGVFPEGEEILIRLAAL